MFWCRKTKILGPRPEIRVSGPLRLSPAPALEGLALFLHLLPAPRSGPHYFCIFRRISRAPAPRISGAFFMEHIEFSRFRAPALGTFPRAGRGFFWRTGPPVPKVVFSFSECNFGPRGWAPARNPACRIFSFGALSQFRVRNLGSGEARVLVSHAKLRQWPDFEALSEFRV